MGEQDWKEQYKQQLQKKGAAPTIDETFDAPDEPQTPRTHTAKTVHSAVDTSANLRLIRRIIVAIWLGITGIQIVIWLLIGIFGKNFPDPWWLWTGVSGGVVVAIIWYVSAEIQNHKQKRG